MPDGRVLIGNGNPLTAAQTWTRYDEIPNCLCSGWDVTTGRTSELERTDVGRATVYFNDQAQVLNSDDLIGLPIQLQVRNPMDATWYAQYRGVIGDAAFDLNPEGVVSNVQLLCEDIFAYLAGFELAPGVHGHPTPPGMKGSILYEEAPVDDRLTKLAEDAALDPDMYAIFTGNIVCMDSAYSPGDPVITAMRDAADAEFPGVANIYVARHIPDTGVCGGLAFHGRLARFDPDTTASGANWDFNRWEAATRGDVTAGVAQIREFAFNRPLARIYNSAQAWPRGTPDVELPNMVVQDLASIAQYGQRSFPAMSDLLVKRHKTNGNSGIDEALLYATYYVNNYAAPRKNLQRVTFLPVMPDDPVASATWALMCTADISDVIAITVAEAGISAEDFFIEGFTKSLRPANETVDYYTVTPNLTPQAYYLDNVFA